MAENTVTLVGNVTRDPELRYTTGGRGVASFGLAVNRRYKKDGEDVEQVSFFNVVAWADLGENVAASLVKGTRVIVIGRLEQREYEARDGGKRSVVEVVADAIGPDLRWAQVEVQKNERSQQSSGSSAGSSGQSNTGRTADPVYGDEEPF